MKPIHYKYQLEIEEVPDAPGDALAAAGIWIERILGGPARLVHVVELKAADIKAADAFEALTLFFLGLFPKKVKMVLMIIYGVIFEVVQSRNDKGKISGLKKIKLGLKSLTGVLKIITLLLTNWEPKKPVDLRSKE